MLNKNGKGKILRSFYYLMGIGIHNISIPYKNALILSDTLSSKKFNLSFNITRLEKN